MMGLAPHAITQNRIAFAVPGALTTATGGSIYDRRLIEALHRAGHDVDVIELEGDFPNPTHADKTKILGQLASVPRESVLVVDGLAFGTLPSDGLSGIGAPIVAMLHHPLGLETGLALDEADLLIARERAALVHASHVLVPSPYVARTVQSLFDVPQHKVTVARPGALRPKDTASSNACDPFGSPLILSVGLLHPRKGHDVLLSALSQIGHLDWQARIVGRAHDPDEAARLKALILDHGLQSRVKLTGELPRLKVEQLFTEATLFALATRYEGYGLVFDEALIHGLPVVSCHVGAVPETVPPEAGILVPPDDPSAFSEALSNLLCDPDALKRMSRSAASAGLSLPNWDETARVASTVVQQVAKENERQ